MKGRLILLGMVVGSSLATGTAMQHASPGSSLPDASYSSLPTGSRRDTDDDSSFRIKTEALRMKTANAERQRMMARDATELLHVAAELQLKAQKSEPEAARDEMVRQVEMIEKLAHNVKERMKGSR